MPPRARRGTANYVYHVFNRAIQGLVLFEEASDYDAFLGLVREAAERFPVRILAYAIMPNHWHLIVWPLEDGVLSACLHWLTATHAKRWREWRVSTGRGAVYQGRFKAIPVQNDSHFFIACCYVERNPLRARLAARAEDWPWSSASRDAHAPGKPELAAWPVPKPADWLERLNVPQPPRELDEIRRAVRRGLPFGDSAWRSTTMSRIQWLFPTRGPGRPPRGGDEASRSPADCPV